MRRDFRTPLSIAARLENEQEKEIEREGGVSNKIEANVS